MGLRAVSYTLPLLLVALVLVASLTWPFSQLMNPLFNAIGFIIDGEALRVGDLTGDYLVEVTVVAESPPSCSPLVKTAQVKPGETVYLYFTLSELAGLRDCWRSFREDFARRMNATLGASPSITPGFWIRVLIPDFNGGYYVATHSLGALEYLAGFYTFEKHSPLEGYYIASEIVKREPEKMFEAPSILLIGKENLVYRHVNLTPVFNQLSELIGKTKPGVGKFKAVFQGYDSYQPEEIVPCPLDKPYPGAITQPPVCTVYYKDLWATLNTPPDGWVSRVLDSTLKPWPEQGLNLWNTLVSTFSLEYVFPKNGGWSRSLVEYYLSQLTYNTLGLSTLTGLVKLSDFVRWWLRQAGYWNNTLGQPGSYSTLTNIPIGLVVSNPYNHNFILDLELNWYNLTTEYHGISFVGVKIFGSSLRIFQSGSRGVSVASVDLLNGTYGTLFLMVPTIFTYGGDGLAYTWYITENQTHYIAVPSITFIPVFWITGLQLEETWIYQYPNPGVSNPLPPNLSDLTWNMSGSVLLERTLGSGSEWSVLDQNNYNDTDEGNPGVVFNIMYQVVVMVLSSIFTSGLATVSLLLQRVIGLELFIAGFVNIDYYYQRVTSINVTLRGRSLENTYIPVQVEKDTAVSMFYKYPPLKLVYWVTIDPSGTLPPSPPGSPGPSPTQSSLIG
jgi:hypothetical protein